MKSGQLIRDRRRELQLTQGQLAERAGTSRARLNTYERSAVSPTADTLERILEVMHTELSTIPILTYEDRRSLAISSAVARKLLDDAESVLAVARNNLQRMREAASHEFAWIALWEAALDLGPNYVASLLAATDQFARDLRQSSPFAGILTETERAAAIKGLRR